MLIIGIAGGTGAGKTTVVSQIASRIKDHVVVIPQDSYYKDNSNLPLEERLELNFDHPDSIDFNLLTKHLKDLRAGKTVDQPVYSYLTCLRSTTETVKVAPSPIIIVEGILIFTCPELRSCMDIKVFVDADADDRLGRVITRDNIERGRSIEKVLERYDKTVKPMHLQFIEPSKRYADIIIPQGGHNQVAIDILLASIEKFLYKKNAKAENKAGLYLTIAVHLLAIIILLATRIGALLSEETSFVLDFSKQEQIEKQQEEERFKEDVSKELDDIIAGRRPDKIRNVVVDAGAAKGNELKDDRFRNPKQVYDEAKELQRKLDASRKEAEAYQGSDDVPVQSKSSNEKKSDSYKGPSVLSYSLDGRKAMSLPIPVYKCIGGGDVYVSITVNKKGYVVSASVMGDISANDSCIREYAVKAAKASRFTSSATAPEKQQGEIVYRFIAQ